MVSILYTYEAPLVAPDGSLRVPDFTIEWAGATYFWEHWGMLDDEEYFRDAQRRRAWYHQHFPGQLIETEESTMLSQETKRIVASRFGSEPTSQDEEI